MRSKPQYLNVDTAYDKICISTYLKKTTFNLKAQSTSMLRLYINGYWGLCNPLNGYLHVIEFLVFKIFKGGVLVGIFINNIIYHNYLALRKLVLLVIFQYART